MSNERKPRMVNAISAKHGQFQYQVSIQVENEHICGGGIIDDKLILTAAHCVIDTETNELDNEEYTIIAGTTDTKDRGKHVIMAKVKTIYVHKNFNPVKADPRVVEVGDIAVLEVNI